MEFMLCKDASRMAVNLLNLGLERHENKTRFQMTSYGMVQSSYPNYRKIIPGTFS